MPLLDTLRSILSWRRKTYSVPTTGGGWYPLIREPWAGAWQANREINPARLSTFHADFACKTLIARDIAKLRVKLVAKDADGIWSEVENPAFSPVLRKPNHYQTRNQFWESWMLSKLSRGNTYVLKERDNRRVVIALYVLNPDRVQPLVADDGSVFYRLSTEQLAGLPADVTVPATEIIHDRMNTLYHSLVGVPPIYASALAAAQGMNIQTQSIRLFRNNSRPSGIVTADGNIPPEAAADLKASWEQQFSGENAGRTAVIGNNVKFVPIAMTADEAQLIEQLKWTAEVVCSTYHVPPYKIGVGALPSYNNVQALNVEYYTQCLQSLIEDAESCLDDALGLGEQFKLGTEFEVTNLLRMDAVTQADAASKLVAGGIQTPNEARRGFDLPALEGGDTVYMQQQDVPLSVAASVTAHPNDPPKPPPPANDPVPPMDGAAKEFAAWRLQKALDDALAA